MKDCAQPGDTKRQLFTAMVYQSTARKRIHAIARAPDGSAFKTCENCGLTVAISLADMHECGLDKNRNKRLKTQYKSRVVERPKIEDQPRSAYRIFIEEFMKTCKDGNEIEIDKKGCQIWKNMTKQERHPFVLEAYKLNLAYMKLLRDEENEIQRVDDEADSAEVGKSNEEQIFNSSTSTGSGILHSASYDTFDTEGRVARVPLGCTEICLKTNFHSPTGPCVFQARLDATDNLVV